MNEVLTILFLLFALAALVLVVVLLCMRLYEIFEESNIQKKMRKLRKPVQPWVTVVLYGKDSDTSARALSKSQYHNYDVVVAKNGSLKALKAAYRKSRHGKIVISLSAGTLVKPSFIKRTVASQGDQKQFTVRINQPASLHSLNGVINALENIFWLRSSKAQVSDAGHMKAIGKQVRLDYAGMLAFIAVIVISFMIHETIIFWYSWLIVTGYLGAVIWLNEEKVKDKIKLTFSALSALFLLPVASAVIGLSQFRSRN